MNVPDEDDCEGDDNEDDDEEFRKFKFCKWPIPEMFTDVTIHLGTNSIKAHRVVLAESPIFLELMKSALASDTPQDITIQNPSLTIDGLNAFLHYLYTGSSPKLVTAEAFIAAIEFKDARCTRLVIDELVESVSLMSLETKIQVAQAAQEHNCQALKMVTNRKYES